VLLVNTCVSAPLVILPEAFNLLTKNLKFYLVNLWLRGERAVKQRD
jgi:hypothetical protein